MVTVVRSPAFGAETLTVVFDDLKAVGMTQAEAGEISERIRTRLRSASPLRVIAGEDVRERAATGELDRNAICEHELCAARMAETAGARQALIGRAGRLPGSLSLDVRCVDGLTGTIMFEYSRTYDMPDETGPVDISPAADSVAALLAATAKRYGGIEVGSAPEGATVLLNGRAAGSTTVKRDHVLAGRYVMRLEKDGYARAEDTIVVSPGSIVRRQYDLKLDALSRDDRRARRTLRRWRIFRTTLLAAAVGCMTSGMYFNGRAETLKAKENDAWNAYLSGKPGDDFDELYATYESRGERFDQVSARRNGFYLAGVLSAVAFSVSFNF